MNNLHADILFHHRATLTRTFKTEYQPPTGGTTEQEILKQVPCFSYAVFKKEDTYWMIASGCTGWEPNEARMFSAPSIWGPWKELANPFVGADSETSFHSQSTYVLPVPGKPDRFIYMGDRWTPENAIDGRYIWLPIRFEGEQPVIEWLDEWGIEN